MIAESIMLSSLWAVDRNITKTFVEEVTGSVNAYLRSLYAQGAILGGRCYANPELNTADQLMAGVVYFDYDFTAPPPAEHIVFRAHNVDDYYGNIFVSDTVAVGGVNGVTV
jgi:phage tail sheath protein FI